MKTEKKGNVFVIIILVCCFIIVYLFISLVKKYTNNNISLNESDYKIKNYGINEYIPIMVDDEQMSKKYLSDFVNQLIIDIDGSYYLLNKEYREQKFKSVDEYKAYIYSLNIDISANVSKYLSYERNNNKFYDLYDNNNNRFIFKTNGVMQYEVLFEDFDNKGEE